jgi:hypothetical protein
MPPTKEARARFAMDRERRYLADLARLRKAEAVVEAARAVVHEEHPDGDHPAGSALAEAVAEYDREAERWAAMLPKEA